MPVEYYQVGKQTLARSPIAREGQAIRNIEQVTKQPIIFKHIISRGANMAGKQFSFFLGPSDQTDFERAIRASGDIAFLHIWPHSAQPEEVETSEVVAMGRDILDLLIARRDDVAGIEFRPIKGRNEFSCDPTFAPVIEFGRCYVTDRFIRAGRMFRADKYWNIERQLVSKPGTFTEWAETVYKLAKASLTKVEQGCYAGAEAIKLREAGVAFEGLDIEMGALQN